MIHPSPPRQVRTYSSPPRRSRAYSVRGESPSSSLGFSPWITALGWMYAYILSPRAAAWKDRIWLPFWRELQGLSLGDDQAKRLAQQWPAWLCAYGWGVDPRYPVEKAKRLADIYLYPTVRWLIRVGEDPPALNIHWPDLGSTWPAGMPHPQTDQAWPRDEGGEAAGEPSSLFWAQWLIDLGYPVSESWQLALRHPPARMGALYRRAALVRWMTQQALWSNGGNSHE